MTLLTLQCSWISVISSLKSRIWGKSTPKGTQLGLKLRTPLTAAVSCKVKVAISWEWQVAGGSTRNPSCYTKYHTDLWLTFLSLSLSSLCPCHEATKQFSTFEKPPVLSVQKPKHPWWWGQQGEFNLVRQLDNSDFKPWNLVPCQGLSSEAITGQKKPFFFFFF